MDLSVDIVEWPSETIEKKWIYKVNTSTHKSLSEWRSSFNVWMNEWIHPWNGMSCDLYKAANLNNLYEVWHFMWMIVWSDQIVGSVLEARITCPMLGWDLTCSTHFFMWCLLIGLSLWALRVAKNRFPKALVYTSRMGVRHTCLKYDF